VERKEKERKEKEESHPHRRQGSENDQGRVLLHFPKKKFISVYVPERTLHFIKKFHPSTTKFIKYTNSSIKKT
jgi:hypothetical protein